MYMARRHVPRLGHFSGLIRQLLRGQQCSRAEPCCAACAGYPSHRSFRNARVARNLDSSEASQSLHEGLVLVDSFQRCFQPWHLRVESHDAVMVHCGRRAAGRRASRSPPWATGNPPSAATSSGTWQPGSKRRRAGGQPFLRLPRVIYRRFSRLGELRNEREPERREGMFACGGDYSLLGPLLWFFAAIALGSVAAGIGAVSLLISAVYRHNQRLNEQRRKKKLFREWRDACEKERPVAASAWYPEFAFRQQRRTECSW